MRQFQDIQFQQAQQRRQEESPLGMVFRVEITRGPPSVIGQEFVVTEEHDVLIGRSAKADLQV